VIFAFVVCAGERPKLLRGGDDIQLTPRTQERWGSHLAEAAGAGDDGAADAVPVDEAVPNDAGCIWDDGKGEEEEAKALIPTHCRSVWISVMVDSKG
jgi:hypothetical protein